MYKKRIENIVRHLDSVEVPGGHKDVIKINDSKQVELTISEQQNDIKALKTLLDTPEMTGYKDQVRLFLERAEEFIPHVAGIASEEYKELVYKQLKRVIEVLSFTDVRDNIRKVSSCLEILSLYNNNICTKMGVHFSLWGGTILMLGTERHEKYIAPSSTLELIGSFAMTEMGHGSNVRGIQTTATYDKTSREFILHSPSLDAYKVWIGGAGQHSHYSTVFARLIIDGTDYGVHAFVCQLRDLQTRKVLPGITIKDCGPKLGLNGIDNGQIRFNQVRIPLENLLNRYSDVTPDGVYSSKLPTPVKNFAATLAPFVPGRLYIAKSMNGAIKTSLAIAIRYGFWRKQFGPTQKEEWILMTLGSHTRRLMIPLARTLCMDLYNQHIEKVLSGKKIPASAHAHASGVKALYTWHGVATLQVCRESCGGQGYRSENRIAEFKSDCDVNCTYEGDNTVLLQQVSKYILALPQQPEQQPPQHFILEGSNPKQALFNFSNLLSLFKARQQQRLKELRELIRVNTGGNGKAGAREEYVAFNNAIPWALKAATAYMEFLFLENVVSRMGNDASIQPIPHFILLDTLAKIEDDLGWLLGNNLITPNVANAVPYLVVDLAQELAPHSLSIIKAWDIPKKCLPEENLQGGMVW